MKPLTCFLFLTSVILTAVPSSIAASRPNEVRDRRLGDHHRAVRLDSLVRDLATGIRTHPDGTPAKFVVINEDYTIAVAATVTQGTGESPPRDVYLDPPRIATPRSDRVREAQGEPVASPRSEVPTFERVRGFDISVRVPSLFEDTLLMRPIVLDRELEASRRGRGWVSLGEPTVTVVNVATEAAAGFPGEVIEEVIVPVPSEIFMVMDKLGRPDWRGELRRSKTPTFSNRVDVALLLGSVVAEGFVAVQAEDKNAVERIGKDVLRLSESLGLKETVLPHTNSILEASKNNHWEIVRVELDKTQKTVRDTMEQRRDAELGQCVSLGGWLRGTDAVTSLIAKNYTADAAELLNQPDIIRHFQKELKKLATRNGKLKVLLDGLGAIAEVIGDGEEPPNAAGVQKIHETALKLVKAITSSASSAQ
ncbi:MAG: hypothetical protein ACKV19_14930 [Verrucomicrobiales bacterium]